MSIDNVITTISQELSLTYGNYLLVAIMTLFLGIASYTDIKSLKIPNKLNLIMGIIALAFIPFVDFSTSNILLKLGGGLLAFLVLFIPAMAKNHAMGGDIKAVTVVGLFIGAWLTPIFLGLACVYGLLFIILRIKKGSLFSVMPFAPFFLVAHITLFIVTFFV